MTNEIVKVKPRIYIASLADYNSGRLVGKWIDATQEAKAVHAEIQAMLRTSREHVAEDWAIHDFENFGGVSLSEFEDIETVCEAARLVAEHGEVFGGLLSHFGGLSSLEEAKRYMEEDYCGEWDDVGWYAAHHCNDLYHEQVAALPDFIRSHIDWDAVGEELKVGGDIFTVECGGQVHVFSTNI